MVYFGPSGNSDSFYAQGYKRTQEAFAWIKEMGLNAYEYSFGRGVRISQSTAESIGEAAAVQGVRLSVHAPYYINLASEKEDSPQANLRYLKESAQAAKWMGATRVVFHAGSQGSQPREEALVRVTASLIVILEVLEEEGLGDILLCPETMGRQKQIGDLKETIALCNLNERLIPCIDFGHLHARDKGAINTEQDYADILDIMKNGLDELRASKFHIHFSHIQYTDAGEKMHRKFSDEGFGPDFAPLARQIIRRGLEPVVICESQGTMAEDAAEMKSDYLKELDKL